MKKYKFFTQNNSIYTGPDPNINYSFSLKNYIHKLTNLPLEFTFDELVNSNKILNEYNLSVIGLSNSKLKRINGLKPGNKVLYCKRSLHSAEYIICLPEKQFSVLNEAKSELQELIAKRNEVAAALEAVASDLLKEKTSLDKLISKSKNKIEKIETDIFK